MAPAAAGQRGMTRLDLRPSPSLGRQGHMLEEDGISSSHPEAESSCLNGVPLPGPVLMSAFGFRMGWLGVSPSRGQHWVGKRDSDLGYIPCRIVAPWEPRLSFPCV